MVAHRVSAAVICVIVIVMVATATAKFGQNRNGVPLIDYCFATLYPITQLLQPISDYNGSSPLLEASDVLIFCPLGPVQKGWQEGNCSSEEGWSYQSCEGH